jgi:hypothetical protein
MMGPSSEHHHQYAEGEDEQSLRGLIPRIAEALFEATASPVRESNESNDA